MFMGLLCGVICDGCDILYVICDDKESVDNIE